MQKKTKHKRSFTVKPPTELEERFIRLWGEVAAGTRFSTLECEVQLPPRKFRWDFRIPGTTVLVEVNGGTYSRSRLGHSSGEGIGRDYEKLNYCQMKGWQCFIYDTRQTNLKNLQELFNYVCRKFPESI